MFKTLLSKEILESIRTWRMVVMLVVLVLCGLVSPVLAKYTPQLLSSIPDMPPELAALIPEPGMVDAMGQYVKNIAQFGVLLVILLYMGTVAGEKERGTAAMLVSKPVRRPAFLLAKWAVGVGTLLLGMLLAGLGGWLYTTILFESPPLAAFAVLNLLIVLFLSVYLSITLLASTLARSQSAAAVGGFAGLALLLIWGALPRLNEVAPGKLLDWGQTLVLGNPSSAWGALGVAVALTVIAILVAIAYFNREEI